MWIPRKKYKDIECRLNLLEGKLQRVSENHSTTKNRLFRLMDYLKLRFEKVSKHEKIVKDIKEKYAHGC